jgi:hypothetical protein
MIKNLITVLAVVLVAAGAVGEVAAGADENTMESLQLWTRQLVQDRVELQAQEQTQTRIEASQQDTSQDTPVQIRLRLEDQEMLQTQNRIQSQDQIQLHETSGSQNGTSYQRGIDSPGSGNSCGPGSSYNPIVPQTGYGSGKQQGGRP